MVTAACSAVAAALFLLYNMIMLKWVKRRHQREIRAAEEEEDKMLRTERVEADSGHLV